MKLRWFAAIALALPLLGLGLLYGLVPPNPDQSIFDYAGWVAVGGGRYYVDVAEQNFPGAMAFHEIAQRVFGNHVWTIRAMDFVLLLAGAAALSDLLRRAGFRLAAWACVPMYAVEYVSSGQWMAGQRDLIAANILLLACNAFVRRLAGGSRWWTLAVSAGLLCATLVRPTYLAFGGVLVAADLLSRRVTGRSARTVLLDGSIALLATLLGAGGVLLWASASGALASWYEQAIRFNLEVYSGSKSNWIQLLNSSNMIPRFATLLVVACVGTVACARRPPARVVVWLLGGLLVTAVVSTVVQGKGFGYHLGAIVPALCGLAAVGVDALVGWWSAARAAPQRIAAVAGACALVLTSAAWHGRMLGPQIRYVCGVGTRETMLRRASTGTEGFDWADLMQSVEFAKRNSSPDETVLVWSRAVSINVLAERRSPTRYITFGMLAMARPPFSRAEAWAEEFRDALRRNPPRLVFAPGKADPEDFEALWLSGDGSPPVAELRRELETNYERVASFGSQDVYRRRAK